MPNTVINELSEVIRLSQIHCNSRRQRVKLKRFAYDSLDHCILFIFSVTISPVLVLVHRGQVKGLHRGLADRAVKRGNAGLNEPICVRDIRTTVEFELI